MESALAVSETLANSSSGAGAPPTSPSTVTGKVDLQIGVTDAVCVDGTMLSQKTRPPTYAGKGLAQKLTQRKSDDDRRRRLRQVVVQVDDVLLHDVIQVDVMII